MGFHQDWEEKVYVLSCNAITILVVGRGGKLLGIEPVNEDTDCHKLVLRASNASKCQFHRVKNLIPIYGATSSRCMVPSVASVPWPLSALRKYSK
jgi:hypothetical protein